jgi:hypothetical protein
MLREDLAKKFKISPNRLVFKNLVAGRSVDRFPRFPLPERAVVTGWVINGLGFSGVRSPLRRVVCVVFAGSKREREARGPPHSSLPLVASSRHAGLSEWTFFRLGHVAVSSSISTSWSRSLPNKRPMSQSQVLSAQARSAHSALDAHRALTRKLTRKHTHTQKAYAESICRKPARAHTQAPTGVSSHRLSAGRAF